MSARIDMLAGQALAGLLAHPHHAAHPMTSEAESFAARAVAIAKATDALLEEEETAPAATISPPPTAAQKSRR